MKTCTKCGLEKDEEEFYVRDKATGQRRKDCKACVIKRVAASPSKVARKQRGIDRRTYLDARGTLDRTPYFQQYYKDHKEEYVERSFNWRREDPEQWGSYSRNWAKEN